MANINDEKMRLMEDEMNRFEAEIALPVLPAPAPPLPPRAVIGANTYSTVQRQLDEQAGIPAMPEFTPMGFSPMLTPFPAMPPPPPPPPPILIPHQVQRGPPLRPPMRPMGPPGPTVIGPPPPPPPGPPGFMGPPHMTPVPPGPFIGPPMTMESIGPEFVPAQTEPMPAIVSATPMLYASKPGDLSAMIGAMPLQNDSGNLDDNKNKKPKVVQGPERPSEVSRAKEMSDRVKASTTVTVGPIGVGSVASSSNENPTPKKKKPKKIIRMAGGQTWEDNSLVDWEDDDFRIFCGDLGNDVTDEILTRAFSKYQSFLRAKVVRDKRTNKTKGFGFVSFKDPQDFIKAMKEMNGRYVGSRPIKLRKSSWKSRNLDNVRKKEKEKTALIGLLTGR